MTELNGLRIALHDELLTECATALEIVYKRLRLEAGVKLDTREYLMIADRLERVKEDLESLKLDD